MANFIQPIIDDEDIRRVETIECENGQFVLNFASDHTLKLILCKGDSEDKLLRVKVKNMRLVMDMTAETKEFLRMG